MIPPSASVKRNTAPESPCVVPALTFNICKPFPGSGMSGVLGWSGLSGVSGSFGSSGGGVVPSA